MNKEETPMEELLSIVEELKSKGQEVDTNGLEDWINSVGLGKEKEYANAKVLEALEREVTKAYNTCIDRDLDRIDTEYLKKLREKAERYYKTEVKPKYVL